MEDKILVIVDMQNDFIDGSLANSEAVKIIPNIIEKIKNWDGKIIATFDTHFSDYDETLEGKKLPIKHCLKESDGWYLNDKIEEALEKRASAFEKIYKPTFGSFKLLEELEKTNEIKEIEICGTVASICVISNALLIRAKYPNVKITVSKNCIADFNDIGKEHTIYVMKNCQIDVID